ncbi:ADC synthase [Parasitella parasitica]|nr:ADC synthase [Parasitella parasitica]
MIPTLQQEPNLQHIKTLIIDNYDSYTFNLLQLFTDSSNVMVIRNDQCSWQEFVNSILPYFDNVIISPGPGRPERSEDFGICTDLLKAQLDPSQSHLHRPVFGVCLGHQGIGHLLGGKVTYAPRIMHGRMSQVHHYQPEDTSYKSIMHQCPTPFWAVRYHSLVVEKDSLPEDLRLTAYCYENDADIDALRTAAFLVDSDKEASSRNHYLNHLENESKDTQITVMGFQHKSLPLWGVQFHPESVSTEEGSAMIHNFQKETYKWMVDKGHRGLSNTPLSAELLSNSVALPKLLRSSASNQPNRSVELLVKTSCHHWVDPELLVDELLSNPLGEQYMGWLDSSRSSSPYSCMSVLSTSPALMLTYSTLHRQVCTTTRAGHTSAAVLERGTFFDYISQMLDQYSDIVPRTVDGGKPSADLDFQGGLVGYFGYEMKRESMDGYITPKEQRCACPHHHRTDQQQPNCCLCVQEPDAAFQFVDRFLVFNQVKREIYICCLLVSPDQPSLPIGFMQQQQANAWIQAQESILLQTSQRILKQKIVDDASLKSASTTPTPSVNIDLATRLFTADTEHETYLSTIAQCVDNIREGEAYEICLTTRFRLELPKHITTDTRDPALWRLHTRYLRKNNPAPFSALMMFPGMGLLSSSPERFLKVSKDHVAEMKPIKGTIARVLKCVCGDAHCDFGAACEERMDAKDNERKQQLWQDVKERAENLMIVDLIRNDLAQVCEPSSVCVPKLMHVETYEKVHHLVSTVRGTLYPHVSSVEAVQKCFPPGSMTGAPKLRSVQLLDQLEQHKPRGVYSGCLGYFSLNGSADFNVVIRTAVASSKANNAVEISVGGGGAITFLSDPEQEWKETLLKTKSVAPSVQNFLEDQ